MTLFEENVGGLFALNTQAGSSIHNNNEWCKGRSEAPFYFAWQDALLTGGAGLMLASKYKPTNERKSLKQKAGNSTACYTPSREFSF